VVTFKCYDPFRAVNGVLSDTSMRLVFQFQHTALSPQLIARSVRGGGAFRRPFDLWVFADPTDYAMRFSRF